MTTRLQSNVQFTKGLIQEQGVFRRGRNVTVNSASKSSSLADYHAATGLEALFGYLYLSERESRCRELFNIITESSNE